MISHKLCCYANALALGLALLTAPLSAAIVQSGNVDPDVNTWTSNTRGIVGRTSNGSVSVDGGSLLTSSSTVLGLQDGATGAVTITGAGSTWTNRYGIEVGHNGSGKLVIEAGAQVISRSSDLGYYSGSTGMATVTGPGSTWTNSGPLRVGRLGNGMLTIEAGGWVDNSAGVLGYASRSTGMATVTGIGSKWSNSSLYVGDSGSGALIIEAGGQVSSGIGSLGEGHNSTGTASVTGAGSKWINSGELYVGRSGTGTLSISEGGEVVTETLYASLDSLLGNGAINVTEGAILDANIVFDVAHGNQFSTSFGSGGMLTVLAAGGVLGAGYRQSGSLIITEGVNISSSNGYVGYRIGSTATATVAGAGSKWINTESLYVGRDGIGTLTIEAGGQVSSVIGYIGRYSSFSTGVATVTGAGSKWTSAGLYVGDGGDGTLTVEAGGQVSNIAGFLGYGIRSTGSATITGTGSQWNSSGELVVGRHGRGSLTIEARGLVSVGGTITIDLDSDGDSFINMATGGMLALRGDADVSLAEFLDLVQGTDAIRYWNASLADWAPLTTATYGTDYTLRYLTEGEFAGYTLLTVGTMIPEPTTLLLAFGLAMTVSARRRQ